MRAKTREMGTIRAQEAHARDTLAIQQDSPVLNAVLTLLRVRQKKALKKMGECTDLELPVERATWREIGKTIDLLTRPTVLTSGDGMVNVEDDEE